MADKPNFVLVPEAEPTAERAAPGVPLLGQVRALMSSVRALLPQAPASVPEQWSGRPRLVFGFDAHRFTGAGLGDGAAGDRRAGAGAAG